MGIARCIFCDRTIEKDNEDCLCRGCLEDLDRGYIEKFTAIFLVLSVIAFVLVLIW